MLLHQVFRTIAQATIRGWCGRVYLCTNASKGVRVPFRNFRSHDILELLFCESLEERYVVLVGNGVYQDIDDCVTGIVAGVGIVACVEVLEMIEVSSCSNN